MKNLEDYLFAKPSRWVFFALAALFVALLIFLAGVSAGRRSTLHLVARGFHPTFAPEGFDLPPGFMPAGHGAVGTVTSLASGMILLQEPDGEVVRVGISSSTIFKGFTEGTSTVKAGDHIIVLGTPNGSNEDDIDAKLIHLAP